MDDRYDVAVREIGAGGDDVAVFAADLTYGSAVEGLAQAVRDRFGTVQILVNTAGGVASFDSFDDLTDDDWTKGSNSI